MATPAMVATTPAMLLQPCRHWWRYPVRPRSLPRLLRRPFRPRLARASSRSVPTIQSTIWLNWARQVLAIAATCAVWTRPATRLPISKPPTHATSRPKRQLSVVAIVKSIRQSPLALSQSDKHLKKIFFLLFNIQKLKLNVLRLEESAILYDKK